ncbi:MAG: hypothetical protein KDB07_12835 [Planctomycetes bacterium]|nr:hypothetical protein [Planctomycetota bacterium]
MLDADQVTSRIFAYLGALGYDVSSFQVKGDEVSFRAVKRLGLTWAPAARFLRKIGVDSRDVRFNGRLIDADLTFRLRIRASDGGLEVRDANVKGEHYFLHKLGIAGLALFAIVWLGGTGFGAYAFLTGEGSNPLISAFPFLMMCLGFMFFYVVFHMHFTVLNTKKDIVARLRQGALIPYAES